MSKYNVQLPVSGVAFVQVEANSEEEAIQKALNEGGYTLEDWGVHIKLIEGNVFHGELDEAIAELAEEDEE